MKNTKFKLLRKSILYDLVGMATMFIPVAGPFLDLIWAPIAAKKMSDMYEGTTGKIAAAVVFIEEILPFDFIPTFTLMWLYTYVFSSEKKQPTPQAIEVKVNE
ncbi:hypothetical protein KXJ69_07725 [Aureisphaera sp. CAU 1614]|uniref:Uncharacterized protein n=1 Tax=Halomarinibacterium sedimenti TaxID=2857106 RepID=A0A9X1FNS1_9FLAO|nr:hypothetical protein [Halomarinibacterium sedimenti]MBW2937990.1 hypothetical protein [Halomarinibacterium sedimenti]